MDLKPVQYCRTTDGWSPVHVPSSSGDYQHLVLVNPFVTVREFVCDCKGFLYRGTCSHQQKALDLVCWWPLGKYKEEQDDEDRHAKRCPHCMGPTRWEMIEVEDAQEA